MPIFNDLLRKYQESEINLSKENDKRLFNTLEKYEHSFLVVEDNKIIIKDYKQKSDGLYDIPKDTMVIFKLIPISMTEDHIARAKEKGIRDVAPTYDDMEARLNEKKSGDITKFRADVRLPGILIGTNELGEKHLYKFKNNDKLPLTDIKSLPRVQALGDTLENQVLLYTIFDYAPNRFNHTTRIKIGRALANKNKGDSTDFKITQETINTLWNVGVKLMILSLASYDENIDHIIIPESTGGLGKFVMEKLSKFYKNVNLITIHKETIDDLYEYYLKNKDKYNKLLNDFKEVAKEANTSGKPFFRGKEIKDLFKDVNDEFLEMYNKNYKVSMSGAYFPVYRKALCKVSADYAIEKNKWDKIEGNLIILDDIVTTGSTIGDFIVPVLNSFHKGQKIAFTFVGSYSNVKTTYGLDRTK